MPTGDDTGAVITSVMNSVPSQEPTSIPYGVKLNDFFFTLWSQIVSMFISSRGKNGHLTGSTKQPTEGESPYDEWCIKDSLVKGWLVGAMDPELMNVFIRLPTAKDVWDAVKHRYYEGADKSILYDLSQKAMPTKQAGRPVATFYSDLTIIWQELDYHKPITFTQADVIKFAKKRLMKSEGEILRSTPLPGPEMVFSIMRREEQRRSTMMNQVVSPQIAMTLNKFGNFSQQSSSQNTGGKCTYCGNGKHTVENFFKKNGYPEWWNTRSKTEKGKAKAAICNIGLALIAANSNKDHGWILDSGATNHMTFEASILKDVCPPDCSTVYNANGVPYPVTGAGRVDLNSSLTLKHTLLIPSLSNNLLSVSQHLFQPLFSGRKPSDFNYETCILAKSHRTTYPDSFSRRLVPFALVHSDVWGPCRITSNSGFRWFVLFVDDCTRMTWLYLMKNKSNVAGIFKSFHIMIQAKFSTTLKVLSSDNGGEYINETLQGYFQEYGLIHETTCPSTPQQNSVAERKNMQLLEITRACLIGANMKPHFWEEAINNAVYLFNRVPTSVLKFQTPLDKLASFVAVPSQLKLPP
ncbi:uncharacterized protein LOC113304954 [Papaver somniferum]|uniref:uncharacterized protein LOC113304954 n=1 Tax=Papaver somniferum TaxID=3469 RepID=UPI000E701507|nr:uncharacterized protein LOC113304954 [Papaver somniferum]